MLAWGKLYVDDTYFIILFLGLIKGIKIKGKCCSLVSFNLDLITDEYLSWLKDSAVNSYLLQPNKQITREIAFEYCRDLINSDNNIFLAILSTKGNMHIGNVRLGPIDSNSKVCKFSMMIGNTDFHGKGYGTKIVSACISYIFDEMKMNKFFVEVITDNNAAIRVFEKNGLVEEGILKQHFRIEGKYYDMKIMSIFNTSN